MNTLYLVVLHILAVVGLFDFIMFALPMECHLWLYRKIYERDKGE